MSVFLVLVLTFDGLAEPWGIYSNINKAMQAQEDCSALHDQGLHKSMGRELASYFGLESCEVWEYELDGPRKGYQPRPTTEGVPTMGGLAMD